MRAIHVHSCYIVLANWPVYDCVTPSVSKLLTALEQSALSAISAGAPSPLAAIHVENLVQASYQSIYAFGSKVNPL